MIHRLSDNVCDYSFEAAGLYVYVAQTSLNSKHILFQFKCSFTEAAQLWAELVNNGAKPVCPF